jgi:hypothetical protein
VAIGEIVEMNFTVKIDDAAHKGRLDADLFRLYELLRATLDMHCHSGFHISSSGCENRK